MSTNQTYFTYGSFLPATVNITVQILNYFIFVVIVVGNSLTIASVVKFRWLRNNTNILICSLSIADLYVGIITFVYHLNFTVSQIINHAYFVIHSLLNVGYLSSIFHLAVISVERFVGVNYPLRYHSIITPKRIKMLIVGSWTVAVAFGILCMVLLLLYGLNSYIYVDLASISFYFTVGLVIGISYLAILPSVIRQAKAIRQQAPDEATNFRHEIKASVTLGIVLLAYVLCWTPNLIITVYMFAAQDISPLMYSAWTFSLTLCTSNSAVNCFIYAWRSREFRRAYMTLLTCGKNGKTRIVSTN